MLKSWHPMTYMCSFAFPLTSLLFLMPNMKRSSPWLELSPGCSTLAAVLLKPSKPEFQSWLPFASLYSPAMDPKIPPQTLEGVLPWERSTNKWDELICKMLHKESSEREKRNCSLHLHGRRGSLMTDWWINDQKQESWIRGMDHSTSCGRKGSRCFVQMCPFQSWIFSPFMIQLWL